MASTGAVQYALWSPDGWGTVYSVGKVISGERGLDARAHGRRSIGGQEALVGGLMVPRLEFEYMPETAALLGYVQRSAYPVGPLAEVDFEAGTDAEGLRITAAKCQRCVMDLAVDEALRVRMDCWSPDAPVATSGGSMLPVGGSTFEWYRGAVSTGGASYAARRVRVVLKNNLIAAASLDAKPSGAMRYPDELVEGYEEVTVEAEYLADPGHVVSDDVLEAADVQATVGNGVETLTVTAADAAPVKWQQAFAIDELIVWRVEYRLPANSGNLTIAVS
jgi:hypothetical protein